jgi:hypothetical protein
MEAPPLTWLMGYSAIMARFSPEEDLFIIKLKEKNLGWDVIEDKFAERFPYRS